MKIAIATENGDVAAHFGRCPGYTIAETENQQIIRVEEISNPGHQPGFLPKFLAQKGVNIIIAGGMGPMAQNLFAENSIQTITGVQGNVKNILELFLSGQLQSGQDMCNHPHETDTGEHSSDKPVGTQSIICITAEGPTLQDNIDPRFGRAAYFLFIKPDKSLIEVIENPNKDAAHGAGIQSAQLIVKKKADIIITGQIGPKAQQVLESTGIRVIFRDEGTIDEVLSKITY